MRVFPNTVSDLYNNPMFLDSNRKNMFFFNFNYCCLITVVCILSPPPPPQPNNPPPSPASTSILSMCPLQQLLKTPLPTGPPRPPATVRLLLTSMSLLIFCLLFSSVDYVPVKGEIIWYLSLTAWLISFSIMLRKTCSKHILYLYFTQDIFDNEVSVNYCG